MFSYDRRLLLGSFTVVAYYRAHRLVHQPWLGRLHTTIVSLVWVVHFILTLPLFAYYHYLMKTHRVCILPNRQSAYKFCKYQTKGATKVLIYDM